MADAPAAERSYQTIQGRRTLPLRAQLRAAYARATGIERMHAKQLDSMEALLRLLARAERQDGPEIHRTWRQLARGLGWAQEGITVDETHNHFRSTLKRQLGYLETAGFIDGYRTAYSGREPSGVIISIPAGVAQSVRASRFGRTPVRTRQPSSCLSSSPTLASPCGGLQGGGTSNLGSPSSPAVRASELALETRARAALSVRVRAALEATLAEGIEKRGAAVLERLPWLRSVPADVLAVQAWLATRHRDGRLSLRRRDHLLVAVGQLDRLGLDGRAVLLDLALGASERFRINDTRRAPRDEERPERRPFYRRELRSMGELLSSFAFVDTAPAPRQSRGVLVRTPPRTPGGLAVCVRRIARGELRKARRRG